MPRSLSLLDTCILQLDKTLGIFHHKAIASARPYPAEGNSDQDLSNAENRHSAGLMRVNHTGEVCAQALYQGQALTARDEGIRSTMQQAATEEIDHLIWCEQRLQTLNSRPSYLNPIWYMGALAIGIVAGLAGDKWSLGFLAETERQVTDHLTSHLQQLPVADTASRQVVEQMRLDEQQHAHMAISSGAAELPLPIKLGMKLASKLMTTISYHL